MKNQIISGLLMRAAWLLLILPLTGGCASNMKKFEWTEDVKLSDGRMIVVQRMTEFRSVMDVGAGFQRGYLFDNASISADLPAPVSRKVAWAGRGVSPFILDVLVDGRTYLVCIIHTAEGRHIWNLPRHEFYISLLLEAGQWKRIPLSDLPPEIRKANLLVSGHTVFTVLPDRPPKHFDLATKQKYDSRHARERLQQEIVRLPDPQSK